MGLGKALTKSYEITVYTTLDGQEGAGQFLTKFFQNPEENGQKIKYPVFGSRPFCLKFHILKNLSF